MKRQNMENEKILGDDRDLAPWEDRRELLTVIIPGFCLGLLLLIGIIYLSDKYFCQSDSCRESGSLSQ